MAARPLLVSMKAPQTQRNFGAKPILFSIQNGEIGSIGFTIRLFSGAPGIIEPPKQQKRRPNPKTENAENRILRSLTRSRVEAEPLVYPPLASMQVSQPTHS